MRNRVSLILLSSVIILLGVFRSATAASTPILTLSPLTSTTTADAPVTFSAIVTNSDGTTTDVSAQVTLSTDDPRGTIAANIYTPGKVGSWTILASYQSIQTSTTITITPGAAKEIVINPNSDPEQTVIRTKKTFTATIYDGHSNTISGQVVTWSVIGDNGTITAAGVFTPTTIGTSKIQAQLGDLTGQVSVVVSATPVTNTNTTKPAVKNANGNTNTAIITNSNSSSNSSATATKSACTTLKPWAWSLMLVLFFVIIAILYALVSVTAVWPAILALAGAAVLAYIQRKYGCGAEAWWPWVVTIGTVVITGAALQFRPKNPPLPQ